MAKKKSSNAITKYELTKVLAFSALMISAIIWLLAGVGVLSKMGVFGMILTFIKDATLLAAIGLMSHNFAKSLGKVWYIIYWIVMVIAILGIIFGSFSIF